MTASMDIIEEQRERLNVARGAVLSCARELAAHPEVAENLRDLRVLLKLEDEEAEQLRELLATRNNTIILGPADEVQL